MYMGSNELQELLQQQTEMTTQLKQMTTEIKQQNAVLTQRERTIGTTTHKYQKAIEEIAQLKHMIQEQKDLRHQQSLILIEQRATQVEMQLEQHRLSTALADQKEKVAKQEKQEQKLEQQIEQLNKQHSAEQQQAHS